MVAIPVVGKTNCKTGDIRALCVLQVFRRERSCVPVPAGGGRGPNTFMIQFFYYVSIMRTKRRGRFGFSAERVETATY
eukprot:scaffold19467_cov52-Attheya_sp.AAC.1